MDNITREELFLQAAANGDATGLPAPVMREEMYLYIKAKGDATGILEPITRREIFWHAMCVGSTDGLPDPVTREEMFLRAAAAGETEGLPEPVTRTELYLKAIAESGGGGGDKPWDEMTWDDVIAATQNGKYKDFEIGATKELDLGAEGIVNMQIVGIDADDLADGSGKAPLTFISKELLKTNHQMNPTLSPSSAPYDEGTGTIGGWEKSDMRAYLVTTVKPLIPETVRNAIRNVTKYSNIYDTSGAKVLNSATVDSVWIPSGREVFGDADNETTGATYTDLFHNDDERVKYKEGAVRWWYTRTAFTTSAYGFVNNYGQPNIVNSGRAGWYPLGFCL